MKPNEFKVFVGFMLALMCILIITIAFSGCDAGWSVGGLDI